VFPAKTNVEFVAVESPDRLRTRVWERGAGETMACGTGACAVAVAARLLHETKARVVVVLPGGELEIEWEGALDREVPVLMTGPAEKSFEGEVDLGAYS
jgi:diaminopimelate epimerase